MVASDRRELIVATQAGWWELLTFFFFFSFLYLVKLSIVKRLYNLQSPSCRS